MVSTTAGFAGVWLIPRLTSFVAAHPEVDVRISTGNTLANLERDGVDVAVRYRSVDLLPAGAVPLFGETVFPVCSPRLLRAAGAALKVPADLAGQTLLRMEPDGSHHLQDWGLWLHAMALTQLKPAAVLHFSSYDQLIQAAVAGQGVALGRVPLIDRLLKAKQLVAPFADAVVSREGLLHAGRGRGGAAPRGRGLHRVAGGGSTRPGFSTSARVERGLDRPHHRQGHRRLARAHLVELQHADAVLGRDRAVARADGVVDDRVDLGLVRAGTRRASSPSGHCTL